MANRILLEMRLKFLFCLLGVLVIFLSAGGYFVFTQRQELLVRHTPFLYWKTQKEKKDIDIPQISGRIFKKEGNDTLVIVSSKNKRLKFLISPDTSVLRFNPGMEQEKIEFEDIKEGNYALIIPSSKSFYEKEKEAQQILVSSLPIFSKVEKYEED